MMTASPKRWGRLVPFLLGGVAGAAILFFLLRSPGEELTREGLAAARAVWKGRQIFNYRLTVDIEGAQHGLHEITVRDGSVVSMTTEGAAVPRAVWEYWTVEGMFRFLEDELAAREDPEPVHGVQDPGHVVLRARFDPDRGYPRTFFRHVMGRGAAIRWEIRQFEITEPPRHGGGTEKSP